eukprot:8013090-Ditylum_brightwellii.AAC.1
MGGGERLGFLWETVGGVDSACGGWEQQRGLLCEQSSGPSSHQVVLWNHGLSDLLVKEQIITELSRVQPIGLDPGDFCFAKAIVHQYANQKLGVGGGQL